MHQLKYTESSIGEGYLDVLPAISIISNNNSRQQKFKKHAPEVGRGLFAGHSKLQHADNGGQLALRVARISGLGPFERIKGPGSNVKGAC